MGRVIGGGLGIAGGRGVTRVLCARWREMVDRALVDQLGNDQRRPKPE